MPKLILHLAKCTLFLLIALLATTLACWFTPAGNDYQRELSDLASAAANRLALKPAETAFNNAYYWFAKSALTAHPQDVQQAIAAIATANATQPVAAELLLLQASFNLKWHRIPAAKADLAQLGALSNDPRVQILHADIAVQEGNYPAALASYTQLLNHQRNWDTLARLAYLRAKLGDPKAADELYIAAEAELSAKDMRAFAWLELQRGYLALSAGDYPRADTHYQAAEHAYSGYWLSQDYRAEWYAAQRNYPAAIQTYLALIACSKRPEHYHALGDLYLFMNQPELAKPWHDAALAAYMAAVQRGETQYYHTLSAFYADTRTDGALAITYAQQDVRLRPNVGTRDALAWAYFRAERYPEAAAEMQRALAYGWQDAHLFYHAAMIYLATGPTALGQHYLHLAAALNPHYTDFHAHR